MHKVLFIAFDFPPCSDVGGSLRSEKFITYLHNFGWHASILSLSNQISRSQEELYPNVKRISSLTPFNRPYKFELYGWLPPLFSHANKILKEKRYDLIYVSCPPFPPSIVSSWLKRIHKIPIVIDFRDAWTLGPYKKSSLVNRFINRTLFPIMEKNVLSDVDGLIVNTPSAFECYSKYFPNLINRIIMIPNGYDEEDFKDYRSNESKKQIAILHCGRLGVSGRNPICLLKALKLLVNEHIPIQLYLVGDQGVRLHELVIDLGLKKHVQFCAQVPHKMAIQTMGNYDVLVIYQEQHNTKITPIAGKTYEYLRTGKPVLAIVPPGDNLNIIQQHATRFETAPPDDIPAIVKAISTLQYDWCQGRLQHYTPPKQNYLKQYNRKALTSRLAVFFNYILAKNSYS